MCVQRTHTQLGVCPEPRAPRTSSASLPPPLQNIAYVPGLYKIFDEILVNAADNKVRDPSMDTIRVTIDEVGRKGRRICIVCARARVCACVFVCV